MQQSRPPLSGRTRLYGLFADPVDHLQTPAVLNVLLDRRGIDAVFVPLHVTAEHFATTVAGMRHLRNFAAYGVSSPHKPMAARLCDELLPHARACDVVNVIRVASDGRWVGETLAGVGHLAIANRTPAKADDLASTVRRAAPACAVEAGAAFDPAAFDIVINATPPGSSWTGFDACRGLACVWGGRGGGGSDDAGAHPATARRSGARHRDRTRPRNDDAAARGGGRLSWHDCLTQATCKSEAVVFGVPSKQQWGNPSVRAGVRLCVIVSESEPAQ
jgi:Shikimate dehydrogenase substrate binding domain